VGISSFMTHLELSLGQIVLGQIVLGQNYAVVSDVVTLQMLQPIRGKVRNLEFVIVRIEFFTKVVPSTNCRRTNSCKKVLGQNVLSTKRPRTKPPRTICPIDNSR